MDYFCIGIWKVILDPVQAGGPYNLTRVQKGSKIVLTDVLFGDVWLCGGQSNMAFTLGQVTVPTPFPLNITLRMLLKTVKQNLFWGFSQVYNASEELAIASKFPNVRVFQAALEKSSVELTDLAGVEVPWSRPTPGKSTDIQILFLYIYMI